MRRNARQRFIIRIASGFLIIAACGVAVPYPVYAEDLTKNFDIYSPEYVQQLNYIRQSPAFKITAPKGWYMALTKENIPLPDRALICKSDPKEPLAQGKYEPFKFPYIKVAFLLNPKRLPAEAFSKSQVSELKAAGAPVLTDEVVLVDNQLGSHVTAGVPGTSLIMDTYIFVREDAFISIKAICETAEFAEVKKEIKEAIDSIKFGE